MDEADVGIYDVIFDKDNKERTPWNICCCEVPRSLLLFSIQITVVVSLLTVSLIQIYNNSEVNNTIYFCMISACIGYIIPAPSLTTTTFSKTTTTT